MSLVTQFQAAVAFDYRAAVGGTTGQFLVEFVNRVTRESGTAIDQSQTLWYEKARSLAATTNDDIDLAGSKLTAFGDTITFTKIKGVYIKNLSTTVGNKLRIGNEGTNPFLLFAEDSDAYYTLGPGGTFLIEEPSLAGLPVTAGTGDKLRIYNPTANTITFDIAIWGV